MIRGDGTSTIEVTQAENGVTAIRETESGVIATVDTKNDAACLTMDGFGFVFPLVNLGAVRDVLNRALDAVYDVNNTSAR